MRSVTAIVWGSPPKLPGTGVRCGPSAEDPRRAGELGEPSQARRGEARWRAMTSFQVVPVGVIDSARQRILLIEDDQAISSLLASALVRAGYTVTCAATGAAGLRDAAGGHYDLVLLDLVIPDLDGRIVLERLLARRPGQP